MIGEDAPKEPYQQELRGMAEADQRADATLFIEFMLSVLRDAIREAVPIDQASNHVTDQVALLTRAYSEILMAKPNDQ